MSDAPVSLARRRAERADDNTKWTVRDCLAEIVRMIDAGEVAYESVLVLAVRETEAGQLERWRANVTKDREAHLLLAAQVLFQRSMTE